MKYKFTIQGRLPCLNEHIKALSSNRYSGGKLKRETDEAVMWEIRTQLNKTIDKPVIIRFRWIEPNRRRDKDNIAFAKKYIQDALVKLNILQNDGWKNIEHTEDYFEVDKNNPRIEVEIVEV